MTLRVMRIVATPRARWLVAAILTIVVFSVVFLASQTVGVVDGQLVSYYETGDSAQIVVSVAVGAGDDIVGSSAIESADSVRVSIRVRKATGSHTAQLLFLPAVVHLRSGLRTRAVLDAAGRPLRNLGFYRAIPTPSGTP